MSQKTLREIFWDGAVFVFKTRIFYITLIAIGLLYWSAWLAASTENLSATYETFRLFVSMLGGTLLTAALLGFLVNDSSYADIIRKYVADVMLAPEKHLSTSKLEKNWLKITEQLLSRGLPQTADVAARTMFDNYLRSECDYHLQHVNVVLNIEVDPHKNVAKIVNKTSQDIVLSDRCKKPAYSYKIGSKSGNPDIKPLLVNHQRVSEGQLRTQPVKNRPDLKEITVELRGDQIMTDDGGKRYVKLEREYHLEQKLASEPYMNFDLSKFVKGMTIDVNISEGYTVIFKRGGINAHAKPEDVTDPDDPTVGKWVIAEPETLLLPGESYIVMIIQDGVSAEAKES